MYIYTSQQKNDVKDEPEEICPAHRFGNDLKM